MALGIVARVQFHLVDASKKKYGEAQSVIVSANSMSDGDIASVLTSNGFTKTGYTLAIVGKASIMGDVWT